MRLIDMLTTGPKLEAKSDHRTRRESTAEKQEEEILALLPGEVLDIAARSGWSRTVVRRVLADAEARGDVRRTYVGGSKGGKRYQFSRT